MIRNMKRQALHCATPEQLDALVLALEGRLAEVDILWHREKAPVIRKMRIRIKQHLARARLARAVLERQS